MKKGITKFIVCAAAAAVIFSGCTQAPQNGTEEASEIAEEGVEKAELTFAWWGNPVRDKRTKDALALFTKEKPEVTFAENPLSWDEYWDFLDKCEEEGNLPDLIQMDYSYLDKYVEKGVLADLTPYLESGELDTANIPKSFLESGYVNGKLYAVPAGMNAPCLMYNKTLMDSLDIDVPDNMTVEQFEDICRRVREASGVKTDLPYEASQNLLPYLARANGITELFDKEEKRINADDPSALADYFAFYSDGAEQGWLIGKDVHEGLVPNSVEESPLVKFTSPETQSWCAFFWSNQLSAMEASAPNGMEIGITTWPSKDPKASDFVKPSQFFCVASSSGDDEKIAVKVIDFLTNSIDANGILLSERGVPASNVVAENIDYLQDEVSQKVNKYIYEVVALNSSPISPAVPDGATEVYDYADELAIQTAEKAMTPIQASQMLCEKAEEILKKSAAD